jgi:hypothetical protein
MRPSVSSSVPLQTLAMIPALAALLDDGIARGEGGLDVAAAMRVPG